MLAKTFESRIAFQILVIDDVNGDIKQFRSLVESINMNDILLCFSFLLGVLLRIVYVTEVINDLWQAISFGLIITIIIIKSFHFAFRGNRFET